MVVKICYRRFNISALCTFIAADQEQNKPISSLPK
jgi:hypothetical protein